MQNIGNLFRRVCVQVPMNIRICFHLCLFLPSPLSSSVCLCFSLSLSVLQGMSASFVSAIYMLLLRFYGTVEVGITEIRCGNCRFQPCPFTVMLFQILSRSIFVLHQFHIDNTMAIKTKKNKKHSAFRPQNTQNMFK